MNKMKVLLTKKLRPYTDIYVDGKLMTPKRIKEDKKNGFIYETDKPTCDIVVKSYSRYQTKLWLILEIFYFIISIFGIFDMRFDKYCYTTHCKMRVTVGENTKLVMRVIAPRNDGVVARVETDAKVEVIENEYHIDREAVKKQKLAKKCKIVLIVAVVVFAILKGFSII